MVKNQIHASGGQALERSAQPCSGNVALDMKKSIHFTFQGLEEKLPNDIIEEVVTKRTAGLLQYIAAKEELEPSLSVSEKEGSPSVQVVSSAVIARSEEQCPSSPTASSWLLSTRGRKRKKVGVPASNSPQKPLQRRKENSCQTALANLKQKMLSVELEKNGLANQLQEREKEVATLKKDLNIARASVHEADIAITMLKQDLLANSLLLELEEEKVIKLKQDLKASKKSLADCNQEISLLKEIKRSG